MLVFLAVLAVLVLWRFKIGMLVLAALFGWDAIGAALLVGAILTIVAVREHRHGRPF